MKHKSHGNILLVELIVVLLFFSLASSVSVGAFVRARRTEQATSLRESALQQAQCLMAEAAADPDTASVLMAAGFVPGDAPEQFTCEIGDVHWQARVTREVLPGGELVSLTLWAGTTSVDDILPEMTGSRYFPGEAAP